MSNVMDMTPAEVAQDLVRLMNSRPSSASLSRLDRALDNYRNKGYGDAVDALLAGFKTGTAQYIRQVQRGYAGTSQWVELRDTAARIAPVLEVMTSMKAAQS